MFHPSLLVLGYRTAADRAALDTFIDTLRRKRGSYGFGTGRDGSFDAGEPDRFNAADAARYVSKYLRPDRAKASFVPLLEAINQITPRDPDTGRHKRLVRPVCVSATLTKLTGVTMGFLRYKRFAFRKWGGDWPDGVVLAAYRHAEGERPAKRVRGQEARAELERQPVEWPRTEADLGGIGSEPATLFRVAGMSHYAV